MKRFQLIHQIKLKSLLMFLSLCPFMTINAFAEQNADKKSVTLIDWGSDEGILRLERSQAKVDFFKLANHFQSQNNKMYCGPTSSTIILNALRVGKKNMALPIDKTSISKENLVYIPKNFNPFFERYTQDMIFLNSPKSKEEVLGKPVLMNHQMVPDLGYQLSQLNEMLKAHGLNVQMRIANKNLKDETIKSELIKNLKSKDDYIIVNFNRETLGQVGGGHFSPLGAYDEESDSFLLMDVNPNLTNWFWVKSMDLINSMRESRGYLLIAEAKIHNE